MQAIFEKLKSHMTVENKKLTEENEKLSSECEKVVKREKELEELLNTKNEELISSEEICEHKEVKQSTHVSLNFPYKIFDLFCKILHFCLVSCIRF